MIGTLEAGLQRCPQPISMPVTPGSECPLKEELRWEQGEDWSGDEG